MRRLDYYLYLLISTAAIIIVSLFADNMITELHQDNRALREQLREQHDINAALIENTFTVTATMYEPKRSQTDTTPHITADGTRINIRYAGKYRYVAVSRDLLDRWGGKIKYGDYIIIEGVDGKYDGVWQVRDTMHPRWTNRIDLLCNPNTRPFKKDNVTIRLVT